MNIHDYDETIDNTKFLSKVDNIYISLVCGVMFDELDNVKHKVSDEVYKKFETICLNNKTRNYSTIYEELNVKSTDIIKITKDEEKITVYVELVSGYIGYTLNNVTGDVVIGNKYNKNFHRYTLVLEKNVNAKTMKASVHCPKCGNPIDYNADGTCNYCGAVFNTEDLDYILTSIEKNY